MGKKLKKTINYEDHLVVRLKKDPDEREAFLRLALETYREDRNLRELLNCLRLVIKALGWCNVAEKAGVTRQCLYKSFSKNGDPKLSTLQSVLGALGYQLWWIENK